MLSFGQLMGCSLGRCASTKACCGETQRLDRSFEEDEVTVVVRNMSADKALGPDDFIIAFFQSCWGVIKEDILMVLNIFHE